MTKDSKISDKEFAIILADILDETTYYPSQVLSIDGVYEILADHYELDVLARWKASGNPKP